MRSASSFAACVLFSVVVNLPSQLLAQCANPKSGDVVRVVGEISRW